MKPDFEFMHGGREERKDKSCDHATTVGNKQPLSALDSTSSPRLEKDHKPRIQEHAQQKARVRRRKS
jgi:hypothetical protein